MVKKTDIDEMRKSNRPNTDVVQDFVDRMENIDADILKQRMANMAAMKPFYQDRGEILGEAKEQGIHTKALKMLVTARKNLRGVATLSEKYDDTTGDEFSMLADQTDLFGIVPVSEAVKAEQKAREEAHAAEIKALQAKIDLLTEQAAPKKPTKLKAVK